MCVYVLVYSRDMLMQMEEFYTMYLSDNEVYRSGIVKKKTTKKSLCLKSKSAKVKIK